MKLSKIFILTLAFILIINILFSCKVFAISDIIDSAKGFLNAADSNETIDKDALNKANSNIYNILLGFAIATAVIVGAVLGITFIFSSVEGKAKISEALVPYMVGCFVVFGAFGIWKIVVNIGNSIT